MGLLAEVGARINMARLAQLTNADNPAQSNNLAVAGTCSVTQGSAAVVGTATTFTSLAVGNSIQFSSQPGVNYVIAAIGSATTLTLGAVYSGVTAGAATAQAAGINVATLIDAVQDAQVHFEEATNLVYDDTTVTDRSAVPPTVNRSHWVGVPLVIAYLYDYRGQAGEAKDREAAWSVAQNRLRAVLMRRGDGAFAAPATDSVFSPSTESGPSPILPAFDNERMASFVPGSPGASSGPSDWSL